VSQSLTDKPPPRKPSGPITYTSDMGANVFPGSLFTDKAFVRVLNGELVILQEYRGPDEVAVSIGGRDRVMPRAEWRALPVYTGKVPV
jgi:hypothetical protein